MVWRSANSFSKEVRFYPKQNILSLYIHSKRKKPLCPRSGILLKGCHYLGRQGSYIFPIAQRPQRLLCEMLSTTLFCGASVDLFHPFPLECHSCTFQDRCWADLRLQKVTLWSAPQWGEVGRKLVFCTLLSKSSTVRAKSQTAVIMAEHYSKSEVKLER